MKSSSPSIVLALLAYGCASAPEPDRRPRQTPLIDPALERVAHELVRAAELRADPAPMRVVVLAASAPDAAGAATRGAVDPLVEEIVDELELVLSPELNLLAADWTGDAGAASEDPLSVADSLGATHVLVAALTPQARALRVTLRLIETRSHLIVATAQGRLTSETWTSRAAPVRPVSETATLAAPLADATAEPDPAAAGDGLASNEELATEATPATDEPVADGAQTGATLPEPTLADLEPTPVDDAPSSPTEPGPSTLTAAVREPAPPGPAAIRLRALGRDLMRSSPEE